jgi:hypothetical protein
MTGGDQQQRLAVRAVLAVLAERAAAADTVKRKEWSLGDTNIRFSITVSVTGWGVGATHPGIYCLSVTPTFVHKTKCHFWLSHAVTCQH